MATSTLSSTPRRQYGRLILAAGAAALALTAGLIGHAYLDLQTLAEEHVVDFSATVKAIPDLATMRREADLVVVGRVVGDGTTRILQQSGQPVGARPGATTETRAAGDSTRPKGPGTPLTSYTIEVERVVRGATSPGSKLTLVQLGGKVSLPTFPGGPELRRTVQYEHDTLLNANERHLLFLRHADANSYYVLGGAQGRLAVDRAGKVHTIGHGSPATHGRDGQLLETLIADVP